MNKIRVSAVSYTNTYPFLNGIRKSKVMEQIDLSVDYPSACAQKVIDDQADIGIIPTAALLSLPEYYINTDFCIGTEGAVDSVFIFANKPIEEVKTLRLDKQSRTSNGLARVLIKNYWKKDVELVTDESIEPDAYVLIGDRTFGKKNAVPYVYDLGEEWFNFTGLPFAFALWVSNKKLPDSFVEEFNEALAYGVEHATDVIAGLPEFEDFDYTKYLTEHLNFHLTAKKREAVQLYLRYLKELD
ncbi:MULTISPECIES: menaquinone biosynthetic enzyme MqnA/MqnD family protein [Sphingobacterium]|jgi:chorismate dehydratase|uniref:Chorismate dehydratase n=1 Tax=Sphingobacterium multivorum TaxID=28454 RepID=A0A654DQB5_SPHMU|nr:MULTISPECIES: menaquinone biosynthesis protein [Sphingobacterium]HAE66527.1 radical SAM protein [Sphingobacterium sp.]OFV11622.1 radical SAM protein [Sphingobacterium sp. HMSC13C05]QQT60778.1 menaquinone biosynthesis protein [Sphingobacterium multivorum]VXD08141.1 Chorismate dehydratase [Sphingobacterium multivorum]HAL53456.1 radical SAM protein [Sphingobacterium sp.]